MPIPDRIESFPIRPMQDGFLWGINPPFGGLSPCPGQVAYALRTRAPVAGGGIAAAPLPLDLHVLGLSLAFILSQDQTLRCMTFIFACFFQGTETRLPSRAPARCLVLPQHVNVRFCPAGRCFAPGSGCKGRESFWIGKRGRGSFCEFIVFLGLRGGELTPRIPDLSIGVFICFSVPFQCFTSQRFCRPDS